MIVCAYQSKAAIIPTLESILGQTWSDLELLIIDDASGDETPKIIKALSDTRIRLVTNDKNLGVAGSRNKGLSLALGEYIAHCDHDDRWEPTKLEKQVAFLETNPSYGLVSSGLAKFRNGKIFNIGDTEYGSSNYLRWSLLVDSTFAHSAIVYREDIVRTNKLMYCNEFTFADDWHFFLQFAKVTEIGIVPEPLTHYHLHGMNWSIRAGDTMHKNGKKLLAKELNGLIPRSIDRDSTDSYFDAVVWGIPCSSQERLLGVGHLMEELLQAFVERYRPSRSELAQIQECAASYWWKVVSGSADTLGPSIIKCYWHPDTPHTKRLSSSTVATRIAKSGVRKVMRTFSLSG